MNWRDALGHCSRQGQSHVLCTVLATSGSTPREAGAKMVVAADTVYDTIGGGQLEHLAIGTARELLQQSRAGQSITQYPLAAAANQCCGGAATVLFESFVHSLCVTVFGAGHVGAETVGLLQKLNCRTRCIDPRSQIEGRADADYEHHPDPLQVIDKLSPSEHVLIMTHDHQLDYQLIKALLLRGHVSIGLIGSTTKWARFRARLQDDGIGSSVLSRVRCPVGVSGITRKQPLAVALSIVTELLQLEATGPADSLSWRQIKTSLIQEADGA